MRMNQQALHEENFFQRSDCAAEIPQRKSAQHGISCHILTASDVGVCLTWRCWTKCRQRNLLQRLKRLKNVAG